MSSSKKGVVAANPYLAALFVILWAFLAVLIQFKPSPRLILPFLALNFVFLLILPFRVYFPIFFVMLISLRPSDFSMPIGGFNVNFIEIFYFFIFVIIFVEIIRGEKKFRFPPFSYLIIIFLISVVVQLIRGYTLGHRPDFIRTTARAIMFIGVFFPMSFYLQNTGKVENVIRLGLLGCGITAIYYLSIYFGVFSGSYVDILGRPSLIAMNNLVLAFPIVFLMLIPISKDKDRDKKKLPLYFLLMILLIAEIIPSQSRIIVLKVTVEVFLLFLTLVLLRKEKKFAFALKLTSLLLVVFGLTLLVMRLLMGHDFNRLATTFLSRFDTFTNIKTDLSIGQRRYQIWESLKLIQGHWLFGRGFGIEWKSFPGILRIDNTYFSTLVHQGLLGLVILLAIFGLWFQRSIWLVLHRDLLDSYLNEAFVVSQPITIVAILISGFGGAGFIYAIPLVSILFLWIAITEHLYLRTRKIAEEIPKSNDSN